MKTQFFNALLLLSISIMTFNCNDKAKEAETTEAAEVAVSEESATTYSVNAADSKIMWKGFKPTGTHNGTVNIENGTLTIEDGSITAGTFLIDMTSIVSEDLDGEMKTNLESHLKGTVEGKEGDFFNVTEYPTGAFEVTGSEKMENGKMMLSGNLNLKGNKNNITIPVTLSKTGDEIMLSSDTFTIDRTKWNVNYGSKSVFDNLGDKFINDDVELKIEVKASKA